MDVEICKLCNKSCDPYEHPALTCTGKCESRIHIECLIREGVGSGKSKLLSRLAGDVFFELTCSECGEEDTIVRQKLSWFKVVVLTLYNLQTIKDGLSRKGYFHWKSDITCFIEKHWERFFGSVRKKKQWVGTISGTLSHYGDSFFKSGTEKLKEAGWWKLRDTAPPEILISRNEKALAERKKPSKILPKSVCSPAPSESSLSIGEDSNFGTDVYKSQNASMYTQAYVQPTELLSDLLFAEDDLQDMDSLDIDQSTDFSDRSKMFSLADLINDFQNDYNQEQYDDVDMTNFVNDAEDFRNSESKTRSHEDYEELNCEDSSDSRDSVPRKTNSSLSKKTKNEEASCDESNDAFNANQENIPASLFTASTKRELPWKLKREKKDEQVSCARMSEQEETYLLQRIEKHKDLLTSAPKSVKRLYRKLAVRKLKRENNLPLLDIDRFGLRMDAPRQISNSSNRVLDRFFSSSSRVGHFEQRLQGCYKPTEVHSPYTGRTLKPFIRRDTTSRPLWLKLTEELLAKTNKNNPDWSPLPLAPIDYSYVRPQHIPAINSLCNQFYWPGIDLTDCLQYPDFTCVVLYKKLVIGFAILVPDVGFNEAYISFILTRPEWRKAKIGKYMLYHLIQTCRNKDITLHVSASNRAMFLYNQFGFKMDEFVRDFYDKYMPPNSRESRHAFFMRLNRGEN